MILNGQKASLRTPEKRDVDLIFRWENDQNNWLVSNTVAPYTHEEIEAFVSNPPDLYEDQQMRWMIEGSDGQVVGCLDLFDLDPKNRRVGIGILIDQEFRGNGYGHEAIDLVLEFCYRDLDLHSVYAEVLASNDSSQHLFEAAGFKKVGVKQDWLWNGAGFVDQYMYQRFSDR